MRHSNPLVDTQIMHMGAYRPGRGDGFKIEHLERRLKDAEATAERLVRESRLRLITAIAIFLAGGVVGALLRGLF